MSISGFANIFHVVWAGTLGATDEEIFSYHRMIAATLDSTAEEISGIIANDVTDMLAESTTGSTPFSNLGQIWPTTVTWDTLKVYEWDVATAANTTEPIVTPLTDAGLGAAGNGLPYQDALAITFTHLPRTRTSKNRFYLPPMVNNATDGHGRMLPTLVDDIQTQLQFSQTAHLAEAHPFQYCVYSKKDHAVYSIDRWMTGIVMDTLRRRRNKLPEARRLLAS